MKTAFDFFILNEFLGVTRKSILASDKCVLARLGFSLVLVDRDRLIELTVLPGYVHKCPLNPCNPMFSARLHRGAKLMNKFHFLDLKEVKPYCFVFCVHIQIRF